MASLKSVNKYFFNYRHLFLAGVLFIFCSNYLRILSPQISGYIIDKVTNIISKKNNAPQAIKPNAHNKYSPPVQFYIQYTEARYGSLASLVILSGVTLLTLALLSGIFMFLMRQTLIVMSRHIEYDQKNELFVHYQSLDMAFYRANQTGDLMNRISEDVSRVRMYTGPAIMYIVNLSFTVGLCLWSMLRKDVMLSLYVLLPLPLLFLTVFKVNKIINKKSENIQRRLSDLTTTSQETYTGIRVIKSFVQESAMLHFFIKNSEGYKKNNLSLAMLESVYYPSIGLLIGLSTVLTIAIGCADLASGNPRVGPGTITEFIIYINMLSFPITSIGWVAGMVQKASASQKRINEFLSTKPNITEKTNDPTLSPLKWGISFNDVSFTYSNTGITAIKNLSFNLPQGGKMLVLGKTGSGKTTLAQLLLRFVEPTYGHISIDGKTLENYSLKQIRQKIGYAPQDIFLYSDTVANNIAFGTESRPCLSEIKEMATFADIGKEIENFAQQYETLIGERGVNLSGGQKQRISIARALIKKPSLLLLDDCLSAVDNKTENTILNNLQRYGEDKTVIIISHRILSSFPFDTIMVLEEGKILEMGNHQTLMQKKGYYSELYEMQINA